MCETKLNTLVKEHLIQKLGVTDDILDNLCCLNSNNLLKNPETQLEVIFREWKSNTSNNKEHCWNNIKHTCFHGNHILQNKPQEILKKKNELACRTCGKKFASEESKNTHEAEHNKKKPFKCEYDGCSSAFARKADLKVHVRTHTGEKPFNCQYCNRAFARSSDLRLHERSHLGLKPFVCSYPGCKKAYPRNADLKRHLKTHEKKNEALPLPNQLKIEEPCDAKKENITKLSGIPVQHRNHIDYLAPEGHLHHPGNVIKEHVIDQSTINPIDCGVPCTLDHASLFSSDVQLIPHFDHYDILIDGQLHYWHESENHCDIHGSVSVIDMESTDLKL